MCFCWFSDDSKHRIYSRKPHIFPRKPHIKCEVLGENVRFLGEHVRFLKPWETNKNPIPRRGTALASRQHVYPRPKRRAAYRGSISESARAVWIILYWYFQTFVGSIIRYYYNHRVLKIVNISIQTNWNCSRRVRNRTPVSGLWFAT